MNGTVTKEVPPLKKSTAKKKVTAKKGTRKKGNIYCPIPSCKQGPFKSKMGLAIHNGKPANVKTHMLKATDTKGVEKVGNKTVAKKSGKTVIVAKSNNTASLIDKWLDKAVESSKEIRQVYLDCALELRQAIKH